MFNTLWGAIIEFVNEARTKGFPLTTNGSSFEREISMPVPVAPGRGYSEPAILHIALAREKGEISATGADINIHLALDTCDDDVSA
jgi:hypothetical protein